jgi:general secretion pathway protein G
MSDRRTRRRPACAARGGFTLLEILLVVGLLALLASFAIPALMQQGETAKKRIAEAAVKSGGTIGSMLDLYRFDCGRYPEELKYLFEKPTDDEVARKWNGPYIKDPEMLKDPWGRDFQYTVPGRHNEGGFDLWSLGGDGIDGNEDDIRNWKTD